MKDTCRKWESFAFYDAVSIVRRLEQRAAEGWMLDRPGNLFWQYRRIEPQTLHFAVTYVADASEFDPGPTEGQQQLEEFCREDGWTLLARWDQMQIFYTDRPDPTPIETDPVTQVQVIHKAVSKKMRPVWWMALAQCIFIIVFGGWQFRDDPIGVLSTPSSMLLVLSILPLFISTVTQAVKYRRWHQKAEAAAENGIFLEMNAHRLMGRILMGLELVVLLAFFLSSGETAVGLLLGVVIVTIVIATGNVIQRLLKRCGASRRLNRTLSVLVVVVLDLALLLGVGYLTFKVGLYGSERPVDVFVHRDGWEQDVYDAPIPMEVEDLMEAPGLRWSKEVYGHSSFLLSKKKYRQWPLTDERGAPRLEYTVYEVKQPWLYDFCQKAILEDAADPLFGEEYRPQDGPERWGADGVWQLYDKEWGPREWYLLAYPDRLVEMHFDAPPTPEQMQTVGRLLGQ